MKAAAAWPTVCSARPLLISSASCLGLPVGVLGAIYLTEFGGGRLATAIRFSADVLAGIPSIITGMVAYTLLVVPMKGFSALAGAVALSLIMIPIVLRTTEEQLKMVPGTLREASLALGVPLWRTSLKVMLKSATQRGRHRHPAGYCPNCRGDSTAAFHRPGQPVLEPKTD